MKHSFYIDMLGLLILFTHSLTDAQNSVATHKGMLLYKDKGCTCKVLIIHILRIGEGSSTI